jgi:hypothetical protein
MSNEYDYQSNPHLQSLQSQDISFVQNVLFITVIMHIQIITANSLNDNILHEF